jgi:serine/threonine-protein kinase HipA
MYMSIPVIEVRIWGQRVGAAAWDQKLGYYVFGYDSTWVKKGIELAPLTMPVATYTPPGYVFPQLPHATYQRLPGMLADALPDDFGNALIDAWMAQKGIAKDRISSLDRLAYMGKRGMGALEFKPAKGAHHESKNPLQMKSLVEAARMALHGHLGEDNSAHAALANIISVGTSAGGARAKAVVAWNPLTMEIRSGQFDLPEGFEHWLLKFDGVGKDSELGTSADYGRIEYAYSIMAQAAKINMSSCRIFEENGRAHFMTKRFDREQGAKHHMQSLCAMDHLDYKQRATHSYAQLFLTISRLGLDDNAKSQAFRRMVFNVMARNCDDHSKNFSFRLKQGGSWELAPAYDLTHAYNPRGEWTYQHLLSVNGKFDEIKRTDLLADADRFGIRNPRNIIAEVSASIASWDEHAKNAGLSPGLSERVAKDFCLA